MKFSPRVFYSDSQICQEAITKAHSYNNPTERSPSVVGVVRFQGSPGRGQFRKLHLIANVHYVRGAPRVSAITRPAYGLIRPTFCPVIRRGSTIAQDGYYRPRANTPLWHEGRSKLAHYVVLY
jgi:hypothetical protein